jgi:hypothetical protein
MKKNKYSRLKRNFLVRFIRWAYKCLDSLFKRKKSTFRVINRYGASDRKIERFDRLAHSKMHIQDRETTIGETTIGELLDRVKWQLPKEDTQSKIFKVNSDSKPHDISMN